MDSSHQMEEQHKKPRNYQVAVELCSHPKLTLGSLLGLVVHHHEQFRDGYQGRIWGLWLACLACLYLKAFLLVVVQVWTQQHIVHRDIDCLELGMVDHTRLPTARVSSSTPVMR